MDCLLNDFFYRQVIVHEDFAFMIAVVLNEDPHSMPRLGLPILEFYKNSLTAMVTF
jgi:hypothetical protein